MVHQLVSAIETHLTTGCYIYFQTAFSNFRSIIAYFQKLKEDEIEKFDLKILGPLNNLLTQAKLENSYLAHGEEIRKSDVELLYSKVFDVHNVRKLCSFGFLQRVIDVCTIKSGSEKFPSYASKIAYLLQFFTNT